MSRCRTAQSVSRQISTLYRSGLVILPPRLGCSHAAKYRRRIVGVPRAAETCWPSTPSQRRSSFRGIRSKSPGLCPSRPSNAGHNGASLLRAQVDPIQQTRMKEPGPRHGSVPCTRSPPSASRPAVIVRRLLKSPPVTLPLLEEYGFRYNSSLMANDFRPYHPRLAIRLASRRHSSPARSEEPQELSGTAVLL